MKPKDELAEKPALHVLWVTTNANFMGGAENYIYKTVLELNKKNVTSSVLYHVTSPTDPEWTGVFSEAYPLVDLDLQINGLKPDIIFLHLWPGGVEIEGMLKRGVPVIRFIHDSEIFSTKEIGLTTFGRKGSIEPADYKFYFPIIVKLLQLKNFISYRKDLMGIGNLNRRQTMNCTGLVVASEYMKKHLIEHSCDEAKLLVNPLYVKEPKDLLEVTREKNHLLFVGQLIRGKGLDLILQAMALMKHTPKLTVCGEGKQKEELIRLTQHLGLTSYVSFEGHQTSDNLVHFYQKATCLIVPSRVPETFCLTGPEAMILKTPVIASSLGGMSEWQEDNAVLRFKENDYFSLKEAIETLLSDETLQKELGSCGRQLCLQKFQAETHVNRLLGFMNEKISRAAAER